MRLVACLLVVVLAGCFRYGFAELPDGPAGGPGDDSKWPSDGFQSNDTAGDGGPTDDDGRPVDGAQDREGPDDLLPDILLKQVAKLQNTGADPLNTQASGKLIWSICGPAFAGTIVVKGLSPGHVYQRRLEQDWSVDYTTGKNLGSMCRTFDETIWQNGDANNLLPAPYTGVGPGNVQAANIGDYLSTADQDALYQAGHQLNGYLVFAFFEVLSDTTVKHTEDDTTPAKTITAQADGFHLPIHADFSWHTSSSKQKGAVTFPLGQYQARLLVTRESANWPDPLQVQSVTFTIGDCP